MIDQYRVLPHRDIKASDNPATPYEHSCGMDLTERQVKEENWCPHCASTINKAAQARGKADWSA